MRPVRRPDNLPPTCAKRMERWEFQPPITLRASPGLYMNCFTFSFFAITLRSSIQIHMDTMVMGYTENIVFKRRNTMTGQEKTN